MMKQNHLAIVILAAGGGTRMCSVLPKPLHQIGGRSMLAYAVELAQGFEPAQTFVVASEALKENYKAPSGVDVIVQSPALGTGDAVKQVLPHLGPDVKNIMILLGDVPLLERPLLDQILQSQDPLVLLGMRLLDGGHYGRIIQDPNGRLAKIVEYKNATPDEREVTLTNSGIMLIERSLLETFLGQMTIDPLSQEYYMTDIVAFAYHHGKKIHCVESTNPALIGVNTKADLAAAEKILQHRWRQEALARGVTLMDPDSVYFSYDTELAPDALIEPQVVFGPGVKVSTGAVIRSFSHLEGATVHAGAVVGPFARLRPGTVVNKTAKVGNFVEIKNAVLAPGAKVNHLSYVGDAHVGAKANIGAGTITCNYDGQHKHKTVIGAEAFIGSNTALVAPVEIGEGALIGAGSTITASVPANAIALTRPPQVVVPDGATRRKKRD